MYSNHRANAQVLSSTIMARDKNAVTNLFSIQQIRDNNTLIAAKSVIISDSIVPLKSIIRIGNSIRVKPKIMAMQT